jgi:hypothetical protein
VRAGRCAGCCPPRRWRPATTTSSPAGCTAPPRSARAAWPASCSSSR